MTPRGLLELAARDHRAHEVVLPRGGPEVLLDLGLGENVERHSGLGAHENE